MDKTTETPTVIPLCWEVEDGTDEELAGWAMMIPETTKVIAYVPASTGVDTPMLNEFASLSCASRILSYMGIYPLTGFTTLPSDPF